MIEIINQPHRLQLVSLNKEKAHPITKVPTEIWTLVFSNLSFQGQSQVAQVCRAWRSIAKQATLDFGKVFAVMRMAIAQPRLLEFKVPTAPNEPKNYFEFHCRNSKFSWISYGIRSQHLFIAANDSGEVTSLDLVTALNEEEKSHPILKNQRLDSAIFLSEDTFATLTREGTIAWWKIVNKVIHCVAHLQLFNNEQLGKGLSREGAEGILAAGPFLYVGGSLGSKQFIKVVDVNSHTEINGCISESDIKSHDLNRLDICNSTALFYLHAKKEFYVRAWRVNRVTEQLEFPWQMPMISTSGNKLGSVMEASDRWVVGMLSEKSLTFLHIFHAATGKKEFQFLVNSPESKYPNSVWLCDDFIIVWMGQELHVWHILSKSYVTAVNLRNLLSEEELDDTHHSYRAILHVALCNQELQVTFQHRKEASVKIAKFGLEDPVDPAARQRVQQDSPRYVGMPRTRWQRFLRAAKNALLKFFNFFQYFWIKLRSLFTREG